MDDLYFRMGKTTDFPFPEKPFRLVLLGSTDFAFCPDPDFCFGAEGEKKPMVIIINHHLYSSDAGFPDHPFHRNRER